MATRWNSKHTGQKIDDTIDYVTNPNLLDNWYFGNPVNQRNGYIVPPGVTVYTNDFVTPAGTTDKYYSLIPPDDVSGGNYFFEFNGEIVYVKQENVLSGYTGNNVYSIDRLKIHDLVARVTDDSLILSNFTFWYSRISQTLDKSLVNSIAGKLVTISCLVSANTNLDKLRLSIFDETANESALTEYTTDYTGQLQVISATFVVPESYKNHVVDFLLYPSMSSIAGTEVTVHAIKLELGSQQTLAHQDVNGNWVLNEIPDYREQFDKCWRYFRCYKTGTTLPCLVFSESNGWYCSAILDISDMRTTPSNNIGSSGIACELGGVDNIPEWLAKTMTNWGTYTNIQKLRFTGGKKTTTTWPYFVRMKADLMFFADL